MPTCTFLLVPQLQRLFNLSLSQKQFPNSWKKSNVTAIHKKDSTTNPGNYRPISLLNINGKLVERCIHKHLTAYFLENNVITPYQSGFVSGDSTINQLLYLSNEFYKALDEKKKKKKKKKKRIVLCDISKAFDRVWYHLRNPNNFMTPITRTRFYYSSFLPSALRE